MMSFIIYDLSNGRIVSIIVCSADDIAANTPPGCSAILDTSRPDGPIHINLLTHQVETGLVDVRDIYHVKQDKLSEINAICTSILEQIKSSYPDDEIQSWAKQETEARSYVSNNANATPLLSAMASARGISVADLASRVIIKADLFAAVSGACIGKRQKYQLQIEAATTIADVEAITWEY